MFWLLGALLPLVLCLSTTQVDDGYHYRWNSTRNGQARQQRRALGTAYFVDREVREHVVASQRRSISGSSTEAGGSGKVHEVFGKRLSRAELESLAVYKERGFHAVPKSFAKQLLCPCWRSDAPFPTEVLADIVAKAERRAQARGQSGVGAKWAQTLMSGAATRFDVGPRRGSGDSARSAGGGGNDYLTAEIAEGFKNLFNASTLDGGNFNPRIAAATKPALNGRRANRSHGSSTRRALSSTTPVSSNTAGVAPGRPSPSQAGGGVPRKKRRGGRPGSADADAGERVYSLPMYLRDHGVPSTLGWLCLPHFFLLGVPKSGTTALYEMIAAHPQVVRTKKEPHWWTRGAQGDSVVSYVLNNYFAASKDVLQAYTDATSAVPSTRLSTSATRNMQESKWLSSETAAAGAATSGASVRPQQMVFGDASASTFWQLHHRALEPTESRSIVGGVSNRSNVSPGPSVPVLIRALLPHARLIVVFRNPVERALSEYAYFIENPSAMSPESFTALCTRQVSEFNECRANVRREASSSGNTPIKQDTQGSNGGGGGVGAAVDDVLECMYFRAPKRNIRKGFVRVGYGIYVKPLEYWWGVFPRSQLLVLSSDELKSEPASVLQRVLAHLKLSSLSQRDLEATAASPAKVNMRASSRNMKMPKKAAQVLGNFYQPFNDELAALTGSDRFLWTPKPSDES